MAPNEAMDYMENKIRCIQRARYCEKDCDKCKLAQKDKPLIEALGAAIIALEKQIPKKLKIEKHNHTFCDCGHKFSIHLNDCYAIPFNNKTPYCPNCGQALDWS